VTSVPQAAVTVARLADYQAGDRFDRLAHHSALGGPELTFLQAQLAHHSGDVDTAHGLIYEALQKLPGHRGFVGFAAEIGTLPLGAQRSRQNGRVASPLYTRNVALKGSSVAMLSAPSTVSVPGS
jgi:hypothetical protein